MTSAPQAIGDRLPGWYGKLPGTGDFAHRRLPNSFLTNWDAWLLQGFHNLRIARPDWAQRFLVSPVWFFILGRDVVDPSQWMGILMPSVDSAGRYFPLTLAIELNEDTLEISAEKASGFLCWWAVSAKLAVVGLNDDMDAGQFDTLLHREFLPHRESTIPTHSTMRLCARGESSWIKQPLESHSGDLSMVGLPTGLSFNSLFDCAPVFDRDSDEVTT